MSGQWCGIPWAWSGRTCSAMARQSCKPLPGCSWTQRRKSWQPADTISTSYTSRRNRAMKGDNIYNGAVDNATGCGIVLELARIAAARAASGAKVPARSMLFSLVTAEEQGLLGSEYFGKHPPMPAGKISLDLNFDA